MRTPDDERDVCACVCASVFVSRKSKLNALLTHNSVGGTHTRTQARDHSSSHTDMHIYTGTRKVCLTKLITFHANTQSQGWIVVTGIYDRIHKRELCFFFRNANYCQVYTRTPQCFAVHCEKGMRTRYKLNRPTMPNSRAPNSRKIFHPTHTRRIIMRTIVSMQPQRTCSIVQKIYHR